MTTDANNVRVAVTGEVLTGLTTATAPTGTGGTTTGFTGMGYVSEDGITETRDRSTNDIKAWQNGDTVRTVITDSKLTYQFTLIEMTKTSTETYYGNTVTQTVTEGNFLIVPSATGGRKSFILDVLDGTNLMRIYIPTGEITEVGDRSYVNGDAMGYDMTITAYTAASISAAAKVWAVALHS